MNTKEEIIKMIKNLPEDATVEDIMKELYVKAKVEKRLDRMEGRNGIPQGDYTTKTWKLLH
ncbi:hypothetical protein MM300_21865 [Evansella sp. LMS18]|uniref:hypothetical protein n=1 Tax=Evansella sp. LMS18 TaxID=2924033 RepID=UPI0020D00F29|nr:hypothetical protein [Evansella sp. LMS18]UTR10482.1 hypothetical protein MM300_21865 [Evansella sp. LMS18]